MAEFQEGIQVLFDNIEASEASSESTDNSATSGNRDWHQEHYPSYVPPHKRGHNTQQDKFVNIKPGKSGDRDRVEGVDNDGYQRLQLGVPFALKRDKLASLKKDFPGVFFHCRDNGNHDHPFSHVVTMIGTRLLQRRIKPGKRVLDVYGNPNACDRFNVSQVSAQEPKFMKALVNRVGGPDFIREVNKWGPYFDAEEGIERYHRGSLMSMVMGGDIAEYDVLTFIHTLYYVDFNELAHALHAPGKKRIAYALVHRHVAEKGTLNDGEQTYTKKWVGDLKLVRQVNNLTGSSYVHPDLSNILFSEDKTWLPKPTLATRTNPDDNVDKGLAWEVHYVNDDTWIVEIVPYVRQELDGVTDYAAMWEDDDIVFGLDPLTTPSGPDPNSIHRHSSGVVIPTADGKFIEVDIPCPELFNHLRMRAAGRDRTPKLLEELITTAEHMINPSALFGDKPGMRCPPDKVYDLSVAAWIIDLPRETAITDALSKLRPVLDKHARNLKLGHSLKNLSLYDLMTNLRMALGVMRNVNHSFNQKNIVDSALGTLQGIVN